jgi:5-methyltetrahydropteroyltriglutamate--homocysteine methyltransferase
MSQPSRPPSRADHVGSLLRLCVSPQCGFSSTVHANEITFDDQRRKLNLVVRLAHDVWGRG